MPPINPYYRVLVTGYGRFSHYEDNPSWIAVKPLNGTIIHPDATSPPVLTDDDLKDKRPIHVTSFDVPVTYASVLSVVPPLHERPPRLPENATDSGLGVPEDGYDLIVHTGVGLEGGLSLEKRGRKTGYRLKDVNGELAPVVGGEPELEQKELTGNAIKEKARLEPETGDKPDGNEKPVKRGFAAGYEEFSEELWNPLNIDQVVMHLKGSGFEIVRSSEDAGLYLCEYINYCALAESQRSELEAKATGKPKGKRTEVLFVHVPPIGQVLSTEETTKGIKLIIQGICWGLQRGNNK